MTQIKDSFRRIFLLAARNDPAYEIQLFRTVKFFLLIVGLISLTSIILSVWWLRPLNWDGSRHALQLIHQDKLFIDRIRFSHAVFQLPAYLLNNVLNSPLSLVRIYFLTLTTAVFGFLLSQIVLAKSFIQLFSYATLFFVALLPGFSYTANSMMESAVFFFYFQQLLFNKVRNPLFYLTGILSALGHQIFFFPLLIVTTFYLYLNPRKKSETIFLSSILLLSGLLLIIELRIFPQPATDWLNVIQNFWRDQPQHLMAAMCFGILILTNCLNVKLRFYAQSFLGALIAYLLLSYPNHEMIHVNAHNYRVFTFGVTISLVALQMMSQLREVHVSKITFAALIFTSCYFTLQDLRITADYKDVFSEIKQIETRKGCQEIAIREKTSKYTNMSLPIYKIFADDNLNVDSILLDKNLFRNRSGCSFVSAGKNLIYYPTLPPNVGWLTKHGRFQISDSILIPNQPVVE